MKRAFIFVFISITLFSKAWVSGLIFKCVIAWFCPLHLLQGSFFVFDSVFWLFCFIIQLHISQSFPVYLFIYYSLWYIIIAAKVFSPWYLHCFRHRTSHLQYSNLIYISLTFLRRSLLYLERLLFGALNLYEPSIFIIVGSTLFNNHFKLYSSPLSLPDMPCIECQNVWRALIFRGYISPSTTSSSFLGKLTFYLPQQLSSTFCFYLRRHSSNPHTPVTPASISW